jgi:hypothetical protein
MTKKHRPSRSPKRRRSENDLATGQGAPAEPLEHVELTADRVIEELRRLASPDIRRQLFTAAGDLKPLHTLPREVTACIAAVEYGAAGEVVNIQLHDQGRAAAVLAAIARMKTEA